MTEREDNVYKAKLAEQAERYDGTLSNCYNNSLLNMSAANCKHLPD